MLRIAIVEDHESDAKRLTALLEAYAQKNGKRFAITWIANANTFLDSYQHQYELVFMDELREMDHTVVLVFLTSLAQYAVESYEVEATDYILKPITAAALDLKLPRILNRCMVESEEEVVIQSGGTTTRLRPNELHYVEIYDHHIQFVTIGDYAVVWDAESSGGCPAGCVLPRQQSDDCQSALRDACGQQ